MAEKKFKFTNLLEEIEYQLVEVAYLDPKIHAMNIRQFQCHPDHKDVYIEGDDPDTWIYLEPVPRIKE